MTRRLLLETFLIGSVICMHVIPSGATPKGFANLISEIETDIVSVRAGEPVDNLEFFFSEKFKTLYAHPDEFKDDALVFLQDDSSRSTTRIEIVVTAMNNLEARNLLAYTRSMFDLANRGVIKQWIFGRQIIFNSHFASLESPEFVALLTEIVASSSIRTDLRSEIRDNLLSGRYSKLVGENSRFLPRPTK